MVNAIKSKPKVKRIRYPKPKVPVVNEKAVAVALDAMKQAKWLTLTCGRYLSATSSSMDEVSGLLRKALEENKKTDLQSVLPGLKNKCQCCALGACLVSKARLYDSVPLRSLVLTYDTELCAGPQDTYKALRDVFGKEQCTLIESAFECSDMNRNDRVSNKFKDQIQQAIEFGHQFDENRERFTAIMTNIIHNGGVFIPSQVG